MRRSDYEDVFLKTLKIALFRFGAAQRDDIDNTIKIAFWEAQKVYGNTMTPNGLRNYALREVVKWMVMLRPSDISLEDIAEVSDTHPDTHVEENESGYILSTVGREGLDILDQLVAGRALKDIADNMGISRMQLWRKLRALRESVEKIL